MARIPLRPGTRLRGNAAVYVQHDDGCNMSGGSGALALAPAYNAPHEALAWRARWHAFIAHTNFTPDLGADIGSRTWWRGIASCLALIVVAALLHPSFAPFETFSGPRLSGDALVNARAQAIMPLAWGGDSGTRMGPSSLVHPLNTLPERLRIDGTSTLTSGADLGAVLVHAGARMDDAGAVRDEVARVVPLESIQDGTTLAYTLGAHTRRDDPRPISHLAFRARFDLNLDVKRTAQGFEVTPLPIAVDHTPLHIEGQVGSSFYQTARADGLPMDAVEEVLHVFQNKIGFDNIDSDARFNIVIEQARAATGEVQHGKLLYIGLERGDQQTRMIPWTIDGHTDWYDLAGVAEKHGGATIPVANAHKTSGFGMRFHPILGYTRMHAGVDYGAPYGSPIHAIADGVVSYAGWHGGHGNFVKLNHAYGMGSGYAHMSRIAVSVGERVAQG
ncbi:MAG: M23 family metallopeptidase, partial [Alphaproteobacteria bacterium]|nr:M23 family metallopeptidase [Alphaproteobacteria bacterium]